MADNNVKGNETAKAGTEGPQDRKPEACMAKVRVTWKPQEPLLLYTRRGELMTV